MTPDSPFPRFTRDRTPSIGAPMVRDERLKGVFAAAQGIDPECLRSTLYDVTSGSEDPRLRGIAEGVADIHDRSAAPPRGSEHFLTNNQALRLLFAADEAAVFNSLELARAREQELTSRQAAAQRHNSLNQRALRAVGWLASVILGPGSGDRRKLK